MNMRRYLYFTCSNQRTVYVIRRKRKNTLLTYLTTVSLTIAYIGNPNVAKKIVENV